MPILSLSSNEKDEVDQALKDEVDEAHFVLGTTLRLKTVEMMIKTGEYQRIPVFFDELVGALTTADRIKN
jgi:hypothetical protein